MEKTSQCLSHSSNVISRLAATREEGRSAFKIVTGKPTGKRALGSPRCRWEDNVKMDIKEMGRNYGEPY